jgi:hypothetical protein
MHKAQVTSGNGITEKDRNEQEVIEFPWVVVDVSSKEIIAEQRMLVSCYAYPDWKLIPFFNTHTLTYMYDDGSIGIVHTVLAFFRLLPYLPLVGPISGS